MTPGAATMIRARPAPAPVATATAPATHPGRQRRPGAETVPRRRPALLDVVAGLAIGVAVCFPLFGDDPVFFLDFALGPHHPVVNPAVYGLQGGDVLSIPLGLVISALHAVVGPVATWLPLFSFFPVAAFAIGRVAPVPLVARLGGIGLYLVNPFVFNRLYAGQVGVLLGYALLPLAVRAIVDSRRRGWRGAVPVAVWVSALVACTVHYAWILAIPIVVCVVWERFSLRVLAWFAVSCLVVVALNLYVLLANSNGTAGDKFGTADLDAFRTIGDPHFGLFLNVLGLYGFWQREATLPKSYLGWWWIVVLAALLALMAVGLADRWRHRLGGPSRPGIYLGTAVAAYFLSLGDQGPTGPVFRWLYFHVPLFDAMREPEKFAALTALVYALCFAWGLDAVCRVATGRWPTVLVCAAAALPILYTPTQFAALGGQIRPSRLPGSWAVANQRLGTGPGDVLVLPWQRYLSFPFTEGRVVSNPLVDFFARTTVIGDDLDLPDLYSDSVSARSLFLEKLFAAGTEVHDMGAVLSEMGFQYVVLADAPSAASYRSWLDRSPDIREIFHSAALSIWAPTEPASAPGRRSTYAGTHVRLEALTSGAPLPSEGSTASVIRRSATSYSVAPGPPGWVEVDVPFQPGWTVDGKPARELPDGDVGGPVGPGPATVSFTGRSRVMVGYAGSAAVLLGLGASRLLRRRRSRPVVGAGPSESPETQRP